MTSLETCIREAVEKGEYKPYAKTIPMEKMYGTDGEWVGMTGSRVINKSEVLLDSLFWQALGRAREWDEGEYYRSSFTDSNYHWMWLHIWHEFIDHLADGNDAESFFAAL